MKVHKVISLLEEMYRPDDQIIADIWDTQDIQNIASRLETPQHLTPEQLDKVVEAIARNLDANQGVNYSVIENAINQLKRD